MALDEQREREVDALCAAGEIQRAAALLDEAGEHRRAARLYEQACDFAAAAAAAAAAADLAEAMRLVVLTGDDAACEHMAERVVLAQDEELSRRVAADLCARSHHRHAATLYLAIAAHDEAAAAYERAGRPLLAARAWEKAGQPAKAARVLEAALRAGGDADPDRLRVALGTLYEAHGKHQAAARVLQLVAETSEHRRAALGVLLRTLAALGLRQAIRDLEPELRRRGVDGAAPERVSQPSTDAMLYGRYRIVREVATTPHARLIEAVDTLNGVPVAVKIMASSARGTGRDALARFVREAQALTRLRHANVVPLYDFVAEGPAMVLAWMRGGSLRDLLDREAMSPARAAEIARAVLDALSQAHRLGILHRDVKPSNLLFDEAGTAKLADFGAAHMATSDATVTVGEIGTVAYMAPEQRRGHAATVASDVYAVGVMLHEMLTGAVPAQSGAIALSAAHPDLDEGHEALLARMLAREPGDRPSSALDVRHAVEALVWSTRVMPRSARVPVERAVEHERLIEPRRGGDRHDVTLGRDVLLRPLDADSLARASAFARAAHEALPTVLRADRAGWLWIDAPRGRPLSQGLTLDDAARERLRSALTALHEAGGVHGAVDRDHVFVHAGAAYLAYPPRLASCAPQDDLRALAAL